jgi:hypothetical protein
LQAWPQSWRQLGQLGHDELRQLLLATCRRRLRYCSAASNTASGTAHGAAAPRAGRRLCSSAGCAWVCWLLLPALLQLSRQLCGSCIQVLLDLLVSIQLHQRRRPRANSGSSRPLGLRLKPLRLKPQWLLLQWLLLLWHGQLPIRLLLLHLCLQLQRGGMQLLC